MQPVAAQATQDHDSVGAASEVAQASVAATGRLGEVLPSSYSGSSCLSGFTQNKVRRGVESLKAALDSQAADAKSKALQDGEQTLVDAILHDKQEKNAAAWYSLGQIYLYEDKIAAADTALRRAATLAPGCRADIDDLRYAAWAPLMNGGIELSKSKNVDSALVRFRNAALILPDKPQAALNAGVLFANTGVPDSAVVYFGLAAEVADRAKMVDDRNRATYNLAAMLQQSGRHAEAAAALEKYLTWVPDDKDAKGALATSYRASGQTEKAQALEKELLAAVGPADTGAAAKADPAARSSVNIAVTAMRLGITFYNDQKYEDAAAAFRKVLEAEPNNRDALYNLANTYYSLKDNAKLIEASAQLVRIEPMSESVLQLLGTGYKNANNIDKAIKVAEQLLAMPLDVVVKEFVTRADAAKLTMKAMGRAARTPTDKPIPPAPVTLTCEFLDASGTVVATQDAALPAIKPDEAQEFAVDVKGKGIVAWRYAVKK